MTAVALPARILGTATVLPGPARTTETIAADVGVDGAAWADRTGIRARHWAAPGTRLNALGAEALRQACARAELPVDSLKRVFFVTSCTGDRTFPSTGNLVIAQLGLNRRCDTFDLNASCMGFLRAFDLAARSVATGLGPVGIVNVELGSRVIDREEPRLYLRFGDAATATIVGEARTGEGLLGSHHSVRGPVCDEVEAPNPQRLGRPTRYVVRPEFARGREQAMAWLADAAGRALTQASLELEAIDWVLVQHTSPRRLERLAAHLGVSPSRVISVAGDLGAIGSACIPAALDKLARSGRLHAGARILLCGTGGGGGSGAIVYQTAPHAAPWDAPRSLTETAA